MAFRDENEAARARIRALEAELDEARTELRELEGERERAAQLEKSLRRAEHELAILRGQVPKARRRLRMALIGGGAALMLATIASVLYGVEAYDAAARARVSALEAREPRREPIPSPEAGDRAATVHDAQGAGAAPVGTRCQVRVGRSRETPQNLQSGINAEARVRCGDQLVFHGATLCYPTQPPFDHCATGGDRRLYIDHHHAFVQDGPEDAWSMELRFDD